DGRPHGIGRGRLTAIRRPNGSARETSARTVTTRGFAALATDLRGRSRHKARNGDAPVSQEVGASPFRFLMPPRSGAAFGSARDPPALQLRNELSGPQRIHSFEPILTL